jgi:folate-binding protein YgfZ
VGTIAADYQLLRTDVGALRLGRDVVRVTGPDAVTFLQGQCSQDLARVDVGQSAWSLVLQPQGKVDALVRATRVADDSFVLDVDEGWGQALLDRLNRFKLRVKVDLEPLGWTCVALRGPGAVAAGRAVTPGPDLLVTDAGWPGLPGVDLLGPKPDVPAGVAEVTAQAYQVARIEAGVPVMGAELTERTIPAEAGVVERAVSFTKGCFTGQELVARIDSRGGRVPRLLRGVVVPDQDVGPGASLHVAGKQVGSLTSAVPRPGGGTVALAYVTRDVEPPTDATVGWEGGLASASIRVLPLVR